MNIMLISLCILFLIMNIIVHVDFIYIDLLKLVCILYLVSKEEFDLAVQEAVLKQILKEVKKGLHRVQIIIIYIYT